MDEKENKDIKDGNEKKEKWFAGEDDSQNEAKDSLEAREKSPENEGSTRESPGDYFDDEKNEGDEPSEEDVSEKDSAVDIEKEYTVSTMNFYEQYGGEINAYVEDAPELEEMDEGRTGEIPEHWLHTPKKRRKKHYLIKTATLLALIVFALIFGNSSYFEINNIDVKGNTHQSKQNIIKMSGIKIGENTFKIREKNVKDKLLKDPYIDDVHIDRDLPKKITVVLKERQGLACIPCEKKYLIIDEKCTILRKTKVPIKMTLISGLSVKSAIPGRMLKVKEPEKLKNGLNILDAMKKRNIFFKKIDMSGESVRIYIYNKLLCKGDYNHLIKHIENKNLEKILYNLYKRKIKKGSIIISNDEYCSYNPKVE